MRHGGRGLRCVYFFETILWWILHAHLLGWMNLDFHVAARFPPDVYYMSPEAVVMPAMNLLRHIIESKQVISPQTPWESPSTVLHCWQWRVIGCLHLASESFVSWPELRIKSLPSNSILEIEALQGLDGLAACAARLDFNFHPAAHSVEECLPLLNVARLDPRSQSFTLPSCGMIRDIPLKLDMTVFPQAFLFYFLLLIFNFWLK